MIRRAATAILLGLGASGFSSASLGAEPYRLEVSPSLCVRGQHDEQCELALQLHWSAQQATPLALCLYADDRREPLHCDARAAVDVALPSIRLHRDTRFLLKRQTDGKILAQTVVTVAQVIDTLRPRRRHGWGIF